MSLPLPARVAAELLKQEATVPSLIAPTLSSIISTWTTSASGLYHVISIIGNSLCEVKEETRDHSASPHYIFI